MSPIVLHPDELPVKDRGGGIVTTPLVTAGRGSAAMLTGITRIGPGCAVPLHTHNCEECVIVLSGSGFAHIDGQDHPPVLRPANELDGAPEHVLADAPNQRVLDRRERATGPQGRVFFPKELALADEQRRKPLGVEHVQQRIP
jgi:hypothetical protein